MTQGGGPVSAVMVVPAQQRNLWVRRLSAFAVQNGIAVAVVLTVNDGPEAARELAGLIASGEVDQVLVACRAHLPDLYPLVIAAEAGPDVPRHRPIAKGVRR
jgi:hypothetical protein